MRLFATAALIAVLLLPACRRSEPSAEKCSEPNACDASTGNPTLVLGESVEGEVLGPQQGVDYDIALSAGDVITLSAVALDGDLEPAAFLHNTAGFIEPESYQVGNGQVDLNYSITESAVHTIEVRAHEGQGTGRFRLESTCVAGPCVTEFVQLRLLAINDFHGNLEAGGSTGGGAYLSAHVAAMREGHSNTILVSAGDLVGGSPYISARFHDEATIELMNHIGLEINAVGNHEFDEGLVEVERLRDGGCHVADGCQGRNPFQGADFDVLGANVSNSSGGPALLRYTIREYEGVQVAFIGMTLEQTRSVTIASAVSDLEFADEVKTVSSLVPEIRAMGIEAIVVIVHQGGNQSGDANECIDFGGRIVEMSENLDGAVDLILSGHTHDTYNCTVNGRVLTSAGSSGRYLTRIDLKLRRSSGDVAQVNAVNVPVTHTIAPDSEAEAIISFYRDIVDVEVNAVVGNLAGAMSASVPGSNGLSTLGLAIADSQHFATENTAGAHIAFMNQGGIRAALPQGPITFGQVFTTQPFENPLVTMTLSGTQLTSLLRSQFAGSSFSVLQPSNNLRYEIENVAGDIRLREGSVTIDSIPLDIGANYRVTANQFLADSDSFPIFAEGTDRTTGIIDFRAFIDYLEDQPSPLPVPILDRVTF